MIHRTSFALSPHKIEVVFAQNLFHYFCVLCKDVKKGRCRACAGFWSHLDAQSAKILKIFKNLSDITRIIRRLSRMNWVY